MKKRSVIFTLLLVILLSFASYFSYKACRAFLDFKKERYLLEKRKTAFSLLEDQVKGEIAHFPGEAGVIIKDLDKGWEIAIDQNKIFPAASLLKVPIMAACFFAAEEGKLRLGEKILLRTVDKVPGSGVLKHTPSGRTFTVKELCELMIAESDNSATNMLIHRLGFDYLNSTFKRLALKDTSVNRKMMDFKSRRKEIENFTSARDIAALLNEMYNGSFMSTDVSLECLRFLKEQKIRDRIPAKLPPDVIVAHKTGLEKTVCHDAGIVFAPKGNFLICVLTEHNDKNSKRAKEFIAQVAFLTYQYYQGFSCGR